MSEAVKRDEDGQIIRTLPWPECATPRDLAMKCLDLLQATGAPDMYDFSMHLFALVALASAKCEAEIEEIRDNPVKLVEMVRRFVEERLAEDDQVRAMDLEDKGRLN